jgi:hypothetical protein
MNTVTSLLQSESRAPKIQRVSLSPDLYSALSELAASEDLRLSDLVAVLINEALDQRLRRPRI